MNVMTAGICVNTASKTVAGNNRSHGVIWFFAWFTRVLQPSCDDANRLCRAHAALSFFYDKELRMDGPHEALMPTYHW
jgi:hypothetical protein